MRWFTALCMSEVLSASFRRLAWSNLLAQSAEQQGNFAAAEAWLARIDEALLAAAHDPARR